MHQTSQQQLRQLNFATGLPSTPSFEYNHFNATVQLLFTSQIIVVNSCRTTQTTEPSCFEIRFSFGAFKLSKLNFHSFSKTVHLRIFFCSLFKTQACCAHPASSPRSFHLLVLELVETIVCLQFFDYFS